MFLCYSVSKNSSYVILSLKTVLMLFCLQKQFLCYSVSKNSSYVILSLKQLFCLRHPEAVATYF